jgi:polo-like kinase 1
MSAKPQTNRSKDNLTQEGA